MMIKLTKAEVEEACEHWLRAGGYSGRRRSTDESTPVAIDGTMDVVCTHTRGGVECAVERKA